MFYAGDEVEGFFISWERDIFIGRSGHTCGSGSEYTNRMFVTEIIYELDILLW